MPDMLPDAPPAPRRPVRALVAAVGFGGVLAVGGWWAGRDLTSATQPVRAPLGGARLFDQVAAAVAQKYVDSLPADTIFAKSVAGMLNELDDPFTSFLPEERLRRLNEQMNGTFSGVGMQVDIRDGWPVVIEPLVGGPSERAGVLAGDRIVLIGKESTRDLDRDEVFKRLRGPSGTPVTFTVERESQRQTFTLVRDKVHLRAVQRVALLPNGVGYVDVNVFNAFTATELSAAVDSLVKMGARSMVLDLRGNPGGLLEQGVAVAELFLDRGQSIVQLRGRAGSPPQTFTDSQPQRWPTLPLAVLLDRASASASEIVAGALQDHDRAVVLGVTSFGKGSAQNVYPLSNGGALRLTIARWYTPVGRSINRPPERRADDLDASDTGDVTLPDTIKPRFRTDAGRTVFGGGGITPDVVVGDTLTPPPVQALARAMGKNLGAYRDALSKLAQQRKRTMQSAGDIVTRAELDALYDDLVRRNVAPPRAIFDAAGPWIARSLGYEMARVAFGSDAEFLRRTQDDATLQRASQLLQSARSPRDVFGNLERPRTATVP
ncbi:S41 family peptidase [Gemmatimonas sp.]|jgi:carboxyl-terminal processing protease|uniref:S41 family peptidase n=1 Tax=Gemmatimonas sp. TaxID=1962908 RepID=UPI0025C652F3|nr:S41 family peptidase [Gemmatimonas sp.]MCA2991082.1 S41 family peptidase [Gemmatimonas sp.]